MLRDDAYAFRRKLVAFSDPMQYGYTGVNFAYFECLEGKYSHAEPLILKEVPNAQFKQVQAFTTVSRDMAQELFNNLWEMGFRPNDGTGNSGHIEALKYHLEDLRKLVFDNKKKE